MASLLEAREVEAVGNATLGSQTYHRVHHIAATGHTETDVASALEHLGGSLHEVFGTLLHGDTSQVGNHLLFGVLIGDDILQLLTERINGIVHGHALARVLVVLMNDGLTGML